MNIDKKTIFFLNLFITSILFIISFPLRLPFINLPLEGKHEWITAQVLIALENLNNRTFDDHLFRNIQTYPGEKNAYIYWVTTRLMDDKGISYYTSFPPLSIILPFLVFKTLSLEFNVLNIQLFNMMTHFISSLFLFHLIFYITKPIYPLILGTIGVAYHIFLMPNLWFFTTTYSWDILWHHFLIISLWFLYKYLSMENNKSRKNNIYLIIFQLSLFLTILAEFQALLFSFFLVITSFLKQKNTLYKKLFLSTLCSSLCAVFIVILQNSTINGLYSYLTSIKNKSLFGYGILGNFNEYYNSNTIFNVLREYYKKHFPGIFPLLGIIFIIINFSSLVKKSFLFKKEELIILFSLIFIFLMYHVLLLRHLLFHEFALLKFSIILSIGIPILFSKIPQYHILSKFTFFIFIFFSLKPLYDGIYFHLENYSYEDRGQSYVIGSIVKDSINIDENAFIIGGENTVIPQTIFYAKQNIQKIGSVDEAKYWLIKNNREKGKVFIFDHYNLLKDIISISVHDTYEEIQKES